MKSSPRKKITPEQRKQIQDSINQIITKRAKSIGFKYVPKKKPVKVKKIKINKGKVNKKPIQLKQKNVKNRVLVTEKEQIESLQETVLRNFNKKINKAVSEKSPKRGKDYFTQNDVNEMVLQVLSLIPEPKKGDDGKSPTREELLELVTPIIKDIAHELNNKILEVEKKIDSFLKDQSKGDVKQIEEIVEKVVQKKHKPQRSIFSGGGGISYFFELDDVPKRTGRLGASYLGNENKVLTVSADGKKLEFSDTMAVAWQTPVGAVDGANVSFTVGSEPNEVLMDGVVYVEGQGYTYSGGTITLDIPPSQYVRYR